MSKEQIIIYVKRKIDLQEELYGKFEDREERELMLIEEVTIQNLRAQQYAQTSHKLKRVA